MVQSIEIPRQGESIAAKSEHSRSFVCAGCATSRATGLPARAMMISSPAAAASTNRERWVFAS